MFDLYRKVNDWGRSNGPGKTPDYELSGASVFLDSL